MIYNHPEFSVQLTGAPLLEDSQFLFFHKGQVLLYKGEYIPSYIQIAPLLPENCIPFELAHTSEHTIFTLLPGDGAVIEENEDFQYIRVFASRSFPYERAAVIFACWHLWNWYAVNRFCGCCGQPTQPHEKERALHCPACGHIRFPMIAPAMIVAVTCGDKILLAQNLRASYKHYALIAGFMEVGETLEHCVRREVKEETGVDVTDIRYLGDQPWGVSGSHMFAFHAKADCNQPLRMQESELTDLRWFDRSEIEPRDNSISIASVLIERFRRGEL